MTSNLDADIVKKTKEISPSFPKPNFGVVQELKRSCVPPACPKTYEWLGRLETFEKEYKVYQDKPEVKCNPWDPRC